MHFENLVFEGGGIKGIAYVGTLRALNKLGKMNDIKGVIGTSVGSIFALLAALKCTDEQIEKYFDTLLSEMTKFHDNIITEGRNFITKMGLHDNSNMYDAVNDILKDMCGRPNVTFKELYEMNGVELVMVGSCLSTQKIAYFGHKDYPDMEIAKAVQISTSVPFFYTLTKWNGKAWCDGGLVENFPIEYFDHEDGTFNNETLGFFLEYDEGKEKLYKVDNLIELLEGLEDTALDNNVRQSIAKTKDRFIIDINCGDISALNFNITNEQRQFLIKNGYDSAMEYLHVPEETIAENKTDDNVVESVPDDRSFLRRTYDKIRGLFGYA